jgi:single-strand DNA-binding protein
MFGKRGESVLPYLKDKTQVAVSGELANREYTDKEGQKRYSLEVRVNDLTLLGSKQEGQQSQPARPAQKPAQKQDDLGDDVPW